MPQVDLAATGNNIRQAMANKNVKAADIRDAIGLTTCNAVYKWINGQALPTIDNLVVLAALFEMRMDQLIAVRTVA